MLNVTSIACLTDNYAYIIDADDGLILVDACEFEPIASALDKTQKKLIAIVLTHGHFDHIEGLNELILTYQPKLIIGHKDLVSSIPQINFPIKDDENFTLHSTKFQAINTSGHTDCDLSFLSNDCLFSGDSLFSAGCGRVISGSVELLYQSLNKKLFALGDQTQIYFGHEYTLNNLRFARHVEEGNQNIKAHYDQVQSKLDQQQFSTPSTMALEKKLNPFLRCQSEQIRKKLNMQTKSDFEVFAELRKLKDNF